MKNARRAAAAGHKTTQRRRRPPVRRRTALFGDAKIQLSTMVKFFESVDNRVQSVDVCSS